MSLLVSTSTNAISDRIDAMRTRCVSTNLEVINVDAKPVTTATDSVVRVCSLLLFIVIYFEKIISCITEETICSRVRCAANSQCVETEQGHAECRCLDGYQMTENQCQPIGLTLPDDCRQEDKCDKNAQCTYSSQEDRYVCRCFNGYQGDGSTCTPVSGNLFVIILSSSYLILLYFRILRTSRQL